ncbi:hypothetical protein NQZ68_033458 [Dissostichus eleginoides]|nr:hypothetical protein NQZ68_033458 [Dissostichus eleginoides]
MATVPALLTVPSVCHGSYSLCPPSASPTLPVVPSSVHAHPARHTLSTEPPTLSPPPHTCCILYTCHVDSSCHTNSILSVLIVPNPSCPARRTKAATLAVPIVQALWYTCTGNIPAGSADRGHVSARRWNRRD